MSLPRPFTLALCLAAAAAPTLVAATPTPVGFPGTADYSGPVTPAIPVAKTLLLPISASDPEGNRLSFTATSDNRAIMVRVKSGNPLLTLTISHPGNPAAGDPSYPATGAAGDLVFQLFRDLTPQAAAFIAGFAQGGFYDGLTFHRLADLNDPMDPAKPPAAVPSFIFQGGDPDGNGNGGPGFTFPNEPHPEVIFSGRGQLALANSTDPSFTGTNGSQFFITDGSITLNPNGTIKTDGRPRDLDFNYTIFGQMTHGWPLLDNLRDTPRYPYPPDNADGSAGTPPAGQTPDRPKNPVIITSASVVDLYRPDPSKTLAYTDAVLVLSATAPGTANITVTISDGEKPPHTVTQKFKVEALVDTHNDKPFLTRLPNEVVPGDTQVNIPFQLIDLERDYVSLGTELTNNADTNNPIGFTGVISSGLVAVVANGSYFNGDGSTGYKGPLDLLLTATQIDMAYRGAIDGSPHGVDDASPATIAVGVQPIKPSPTVIEGAPGVALSGVPVATYQSSNPRAAAGDVSATINWGDGSYQTVSGTKTANFAADSITASGQPSSGAFQVLGSHTYTRPGIYAVTVDFRDPTGGEGLNLKVTSMAVISAGPLVAAGRTFVLGGRQAVQQTVATFTDATAGGAYTAVIDWGDGVVSPAEVVANPAGTYAVIGSHAYVDPETFPILTHIHRAGNAAEEATAWSLVHVTGFVGQQHLPPFNQSHLAAALSGIPLVPSNTSAGDKPLKATVGSASQGNSQTYLSYQINIVNSGNLKSAPGNLRLFLSTAEALDPVTLKGLDGTTPIPLKIGPYHTDAIIPPLGPGAGVSFKFDASPYGEFRLMPPRNETASGYNVLAHLEYADPIARYEPIQREAVAGKVSGIITSKTSVQTDEAGTSATFTVNLDKPPGKDSNGALVTLVVPLTLSNPAAATVSPSTLVFTNSNWSTPQTVTVKGVSAIPPATTSNPNPGVPNDGDQTFTLTVGPAAGGGLLNQTSATVSGTTKDISRNIIANGFDLQTSDPNGPNPTATFTVTLGRTPVAPVTVVVRSSNPGEGLLSSGTPAPASSVTLTFTPPVGSAKPQLSQTVTIHGQDDGTRSGSTSYSITFDPAQSSDLEFKAVAPAPLQVTNIHYPKPTNP